MQPLTEGPPVPLPASVMAILPAWVARQRWYAGKGRFPVLTRIGGLRLEDPTGEADIAVHLLLDESGRTPVTYQVPLTCRTRQLAGGDQALVAAVGPGNQDTQHLDSHLLESHHLDTQYFYDAPHDPAFAAALLRLMMDEQHVGIGQGHRLASADPGEVVASRVLVGEQSNTSIILDLADAHGDPSKPLICKLFRVVQHGENPDVVVQSALSAAGSPRVPGSVGFVSGQWPETTAADGVAAGHLAFIQEFLPGVQDAWRVALRAVAAGDDFIEQARTLGQATGEVHATLAQAMGTREATADDVLELTRSMRARHAAAVGEVPALVEYDQLVREAIDAVSSAIWPALQRIHGDYHLGQVLNAPGRGWVLVDFEGEPLRPLVERNRPDLTLRDVAGMLRSFDYAAGSWEQEHPGGSAAPWATGTRTAFLDGYTSSAARDPREDADLLNALELDKALYEVVYEARNRPTWLSIPITAIARLATARLTASPRSDLRS